MAAVADVAGRVGLEQRVAELEAALAAALGEIAQLRAVIVERDAELVEARERIADLTAQINRNSSNSSVPPSSDGLAKKPALPRKRGGKRGKQPGSPGRHLAQVDDPDEVVEHRPAACRGCGAGLDDAVQVGTSRRQVFDLPPVRLQVTEHRAVRCRCACGTVTSGTFPAVASAPACYGPGVRAAIVYLTVVHHLPVARAAEVLSDLVGAPVASGTVAGVTGEAATKVTPAVEVIRRMLADSKVAHFDETGARVAGSLHWVHSASTDRLTHYTVHKRRGHVAMDAAGILPIFGGVAVHDCWSPYRHYPIDHALCGAHLLRELTAAAETGRQDWAVTMSRVLLDGLDAADTARTQGRDRIEPTVLADIVARYQEAIAAGHAANPPPPKSGRRGRTKKSKPANLLGRLDVLRDDVLRFTVDLDVPFTNNLAERDIRMTKLQQKVSGCWRTLAGAQAFATIRSYISTARKHDTNVLDALRQAFDGNPWTPPAAIA